MKNSKKDKNKCPFWKICLQILKKKLFVTDCSQKCVSSEDFCDHKIFLEKSIKKNFHLDVFFVIIYTENG